MITDISLRALRRASVLGPLLRFVGILTLSIVSSSCTDAKREPDEDKPKPASSSESITFSAAKIQHAGVHWVPVTMSDVAAVLEVPGELTPHQDRTARLGAPAEARVLEVHVKMGDHVTEGQPLVTLQSQEGTAARADHDKAVAGLNSQRAQTTYARTARERAERLLAIKAISRQDVERARAEDELAQASLTQAQAEMARTQAVVTQLGVDLVSGAMVVRSPLSGIVLRRDATPGAVVAAGTPLIAVTDPRILELEIAVPDRSGSILQPGNTVRFVVPTAPTDTIVAKIETVGGALDPETRTVPARAHVPNAKGRLRPEMFATVWVEGRERRPAALVPDTAVQLLDERPVVFVAVPEMAGGARFERRDVEVGATAGGQTQILRGLRPRDQVVIGGAFAIKSEFSRAKMAKD